MASRAYVLIECKKGKSADVARKLRTRPEIVTADVVTGPYDILATVEAKTTESITKTVLTDFPDMPQVIKTTTCVVIPID